MGRVILLVIALVAACGDNLNVVPDAPPVEPTCVAEPEPFVKQATLALLGRRPHSHAETTRLTALYTAATERGEDPKAVVARAIMDGPEYADRWIDVAMDSLHVQRDDIQSEASCWMARERTGADPGLATAVRANAATGIADSGGNWTLLDLAHSALALDDLTPLYRAQLFSLVSHPIPAANVPPVQAELARREDLGTTFDTAYLHRDLVCLGCHTSERSITDADDPVLDRHWPAPGAAEAAIYGAADGIAPGRAHAAFRVDGFLVDPRNNGVRPWSWSQSCGKFRAPATVPDDPAGLDAWLASVRGPRATVFDLEQALARGFASLRATGAPAPGTTLTDPDAALAWLVTLKMTEDMWREATGTSLTIANYFPRNRAASELLTSLATTLVASSYSLKSLLVAIVSSEYFNLHPPETGCAGGPYPLAAVLDPWVLADPDPVRRGNGPGDGVQPVPPRVLVSAANAALAWSPPPAATRFPDYGEGCTGATCQEMNAYCQQFGACCVTAQAVCVEGGVDAAEELPFQRGIGMFLRNSERGFAGLDFQARLAWEDRYGACARPRWVTEDAIDRLFTAAAADPDATVADLVIALKDRIISEPVIADGPEATALTAIVGPLDAPATVTNPTALRQVCAALLASPQFLLRGIAGRSGPAPRLVLPD